MVRLLFLKLGSNPETRPIVENIRARLGDCFIAGVEDWLDTPNSVYDEVITSHDDALFGAYSKVNMDRLCMTPTLYEEFRKFEGLAMRMVDRVKYHDQQKYLRGRGMPAYNDSFQDRSDLVFRHVLFWDFILRNYNFDAVITQNFAHIGWELALCRLCEAREIPVLFFNDVGQFPRTLYLQESVESLGDLSLGRALKKTCSHRLLPESPGRITAHLARLQKISPGTDPLFTKFGVAQGQSFSTGVVSAILTLGNVRNEVRTIRDLVVLSYPKMRRLICSPIETFRQFSGTLQRVRLVRQSQRDERRTWSQLPIAAPFVYLPLHFQPEASTSAKGRHFVEQREAVAMVAASLPKGWSLAVKEHPHQYRRLYPRPEGYWQRIANIPNVVVLPISADNESVVALSEGVVSISHSTIAVDAWATGKRVVFLGDSHLREAPGVNVATSLEELQAIWSQPAVTIKNEAMLAYLKDVESSTFEGVLYGSPSYLSLDEQRNVVARTQNNITEAILAWLSLKGLFNYPHVLR